MTTKKQIKKFERWREEFQRDGVKATLDGKWPTGTWLQARRAELKRREAKELEEGEHNG